MNTSDTSDTSNDVSSDPSDGSIPPHEPSDGSNVSDTPPEPSDVSPEPSCSATSESSETPPSNSSSSGHCSVSFVINGPFLDQRGAGGFDTTMTVKLSGCDPEKATFKWDIAPKHALWQNEINSVSWDERRVDPLDPLEWEARPPWYGWRPERLCYENSAGYYVSLTVTCEHGKCSYGPKLVSIDMPTFGDRAELIDFSDPKLAPFETVTRASQTIPVWYWCWLRVKGWGNKKGSPIHADHFSQYRDKIRKEEDYHVRQMNGEVPFEQGGLGDLFTAGGINYWMGGTMNNGWYLFGGATPEEAELSALNTVWPVIDIEIRECNRLFEARRCLAEKRAKEFADYREAFTLCCTYDFCCDVTFPPWPERHPAYP